MCSTFESETSLTVTGMRRTKQTTFDLVIQNVMSGSRHGLQLGGRFLQQFPKFETRDDTFSISLVHPRK